MREMKLSSRLYIVINYQYIIVSMFYQVQTRSLEFGILLFSQDQQVL